MKQSWKLRALAGATVMAASAACSASKSATPGSPTGPSATLTARIRTSDVLTGSVISGATVSGSGLTSGTTDSAGSVTLSTATSSSYGVDIANAGYITRNTIIHVPGADASINLIKSNFDLTSFDQMFRPQGAALRRWTSAPALRVLNRVVEFVNTGTTYVGTEEVLTQPEIDAFGANLSYGLPLLTGNVLPAFSNVETQAVAAGESVNLLVEGRITIARCNGLAAARGSAGLAQTLFVEATNVVVGASICVDKTNDVNVAANRLAVRLHELGHALGAFHVESRSSVLMTPTISVTDITDWDKDASKIAYLRQPGSRSPDRDPSSYSVNNLRLRTIVFDQCGSIR